MMMMTLEFPAGCNDAKKGMPKMVQKRWGREDPLKNSSEQVELNLGFSLISTQFPIGDI